MTYYKTCDESDGDGPYGYCPHFAHDHRGLVPVAEGAIIIEDPEAAIERMLDVYDHGHAVPMGAKKRAEKRFLCARLLAAAEEKPERNAQ